MRVSKYIKPHKDILIEYIYDDGNNISEPYNILVNSRDNTYSFVSTESSSSNNTTENQLLPLDRVTNNYGIVNTSTYTFLQYKQYASGFPIRYDTIKVHVPINYTFGEYLGCYLRVYTLGKDNKKEFDLSNFYFDNTDVNMSGMLDYTSPPLKFQEKLWGKELRIDIPSTFYVSNQLSGTAPKTNSVNANLTNGVGLSQTAPIFIDFSFITQKKTINKVTSYYLTSRNTISFPQTPDFEKLGVRIKHSTNGDFFEIFGVYNGNIAEFKTFIDNAKTVGNRYYVEYTITLYEQNIRGKSFKVVMTDNFNEEVEYRPIIKYTSTTAIIDVEMNLIDAVDNSSIYRRASYGMLQDEVAKYSLNLSKINLAKSNKPKIYNIKSPEGVGIFGRNKNNSLVSSDSSSGVVTQTILEPIKINYTVLVDKFNLIAKSDSVNIGKNNFYGLGKLQILLQPFDNIVLFNIARDISTEQVPSRIVSGTLEEVKSPDYMDMTNMGEIKMIIKNSQLSVESKLYLASNSVDLSKGQVVFKIPASRMNDVRKIYDSGVNLFYITNTQDAGTNVIYSGLFNIYDSKKNIADINDTQKKIQAELLTNPDRATIIVQDTAQQGTAIVTRRIVSGNLPSSGASMMSGTNASSSTPATTKINGITYTVSEKSSFVVDGYEFTSSQIKGALNLDVNPIRLSIKTDSLYSNDKYLDTLVSLTRKLQSKYITTAEEQTRQTQIVTNFKNNNA